MNNITVLVAANAHAVSGRPARSRADATAAALALGLNASARLLSAGAMPGSVARDYLALGAKRIDILECGIDADLAATLLPALRDVPWVLTGTRTEAEQATGLLPHRLAAALGRPLVTDVLAVQPDGDAWIVTQALPKGARRRLRVSPPAVLAISAASPQTLRHALADAMAGQIMRTTARGAATVAPTGQLVPSSKRRKLLEAKTAQSGHARMLGAIDTPSTGGAVLRTGDAHSKAQAVLDYLRTHSLVPF
ncbi:MAG: electron transfer flavoprotein beta subunit [Rhodoferax sp.]|nr:electron transfer flavoprotein beta subunit [Rhodoferax sp.]